ncbi:MAG: biopolymertransporter ExbD/TolR [Planctomycetota bacterium]|nr:MAG: biopolymertransporter ExbD/TolR [Planctomycetota bacterium]
MSGARTEGEADLTPMLDMVFQLITFFMLVTSFKAASLDLSLRLPVVGSARPVETEGEESLLILNVNKEGQLMVYSLPQDIVPYLKAEAKSSRLEAKRKNPKFKDTDDLPATVVVRADKETPFGLLNLVIKNCQDNGFRKFALKATDRATE